MMGARVITKREFEAMPAYQRGYAVYMLGARDEQPHVPDEKNPFPKGTSDHEEWKRGATNAYLHVLDSEE